MSRKGCPLATAEVDEEAERRGRAGVELSEAGAVPGLLLLLLRWGRILAGRCQRRGSGTGWGIWLSPRVREWP